MILGRARVLAGPEGRAGPETEAASGALPGRGRSVRGGAPIAVRIASLVPIMILIAVGREGPG